METKFINRALLFLLCFSFSVSAQTNRPSLRITSANGVSTVFWPLAAYEDILQTTTNLSPTATWTNLATAEQVVSAFPSPGGYAAYTTNIIGDEIAFSLPATNARQFFRLITPRYIPLCSFAIFYNGLLEFSQTAPMIINGRVHANGPIYVGTSASLTFNAPVTTTSTISSPMADGLGPWTTTNWNTFFNGRPDYITNAASWEIPTNFHYVIDVPPASEVPWSGLMRLYNEAQIVLIVTNDISGNGNPTVQLILQSYVPSNGGPDPDKVILTYTNASTALLGTNLPFLNLTNNFYDQREYKTNLVTQIDVSSFASWVATNSTVQDKFGIFVYLTMFYVADRRNVTDSQLSVVRLRNGAQLPANSGYGFTLATPNPLYIWGNYNTQISASGANASASTTNTAYTVPAALFSDSLTVLSPNFTDSESYSAYNSSISIFDAADMTINAAIITGTMPSTGTNGTTFSGGIHNLPRLLEDWSAKNLWLNTSIIRLWDSNKATNQFRNPQGFIPAPVNPYYNPPTRHLSFDQNFLNGDKIPPGIPGISLAP